MNEVGSKLNSVFSFVFLGFGGPGGGFGAPGGSSSDDAATATKTQKKTPPGAPKPST